MMKIIVLLVLVAVSLSGRNAVGSIPSRYLAFAFAGVGALLWAATFDSLRQITGVPDGPLYRRLIVWSALGVLASIGGLVASFWCRNRPLKIFTILTGVASAIMCSLNIIVPY
jgi:hypothetical protein